MEQCTVVFDYSIGDEVKILAIGMTGRVESLSQDIQGKMYRIIYWNDGVRFSSYMYDWEIQ